MTQTRPDLPKGPDKRAGNPTGQGNVTHMLSFLEDTARQKVFLDNLARSFRIREACNSVGICYATYGNAKAKSVDFALGVQDAKERYKELIEKTIHDRAITGWEEDVWFQGQKVGKTRKFSDRLLLAKAQRHIPEYAKKSQVETTVSGQVTLGLEVLSKEDRSELRSILERRQTTIPSEN